MNDYESHVDDSWRNRVRGIWLEFRGWWMQLRCPHKQTRISRHFNHSERVIETYEIESCTGCGKPMRRTCISVFFTKKENDDV